MNIGLNERDNTRNDYMNNISKIQNKEATICVKCRHHVNIEPSGPRSNVWYNHLCSHPENFLKKTIDLVTGEVKYASKNDLGSKDLSEEQRPRCRDVNDGECQHYETT